jgi:hypothetical protein
MTLNVTLIHRYFYYFMHYQPYLWANTTGMNFYTDTTLSIHDCPINLRSGSTEQEIST